jgi:hypothetical protein
MWGNIFHLACKGLHMFGWSLRGALWKTVQVVHFVNTCGYEGGTAEWPLGCLLQGHTGNVSLP